MTRVGQHALLALFVKFILIFNQINKFNSDYKALPVSLIYTMLHRGVIWLLWVWKLDSIVLLIALFSKLNWSFIICCCQTLSTHSIKRSSTSASIDDLARFNTVTSQLLFNFDIKDTYLTSVRVNTYSWFLLLLENIWYTKYNVVYLFVFGISYGNVWKVKFK